ncbi:sodium transporter HKT1-like [Pyrus ussuriensis x Pyrus communis]|uniref:Sodium transporter HKT1-like n=1 Tax=Pyrus ussuriensis x Pyrus communis TaxID=2448454 RepID=A0A5N5GKT1_9ROSA|nr:sodium transporter HKT1-like [Pyrus ussuriensis x Pyrus communis]
MNNSAYFGKKVQQLCSCSFHKLAHLSKSIGLLLCYYLYFVTPSFLGFEVLKALKPRTDHSLRPRNLDLLLTLVSATTVSSMSTVEMEVFSNDQLIILTILLFIVFTSVAGLQLKKFKLMLLAKHKVVSISSDVSSSSSPTNLVIDPIEMGLATKRQDLDLRMDIDHGQIDKPLDGESLKFHAVSLYLAVISNARNVLKTKGLNLHTFWLFTTISTFLSCGFVPTNENMMAFSKNSGLLLILIPQVLLGNTLLPSCLRFFIWNTGEIGFLHLLPSLHSSILVVTVFGLIRSSDSLSGLNPYQQIIGALFQSVNSRLTGETILDLSITSPAILVLFVVMMYLPPYTSFLPIEDDDHPLQPYERKKTRRGKVVETPQPQLFSQLSYLAIFIILVCITEQKKIKEDPLNFNVLNIVIEVINDEGKMVVMAVMFFGRLEILNMEGGRAWKLL